MGLPDLGGAFIDKVSLRSGVSLYTSIKTIQLPVDSGLEMKCRP